MNMTKFVASLTPEERYLLEVALTDTIDRNVLTEYERSLWCNDNKIAAVRLYRTHADSMGLWDTVQMFRRLTGVE